MNISKILHTKQPHVHWIYTEHDIDSELQIKSRHLPSVCLRGVLGTRKVWVPVGLPEGIVLWSRTPVVNIYLAFKIYFCEWQCFWILNKLSSKWVYGCQIDDKSPLYRAWCEKLSPKPMMSNVTLVIPKSSTYRQPAVAHPATGRTTVVTNLHQMHCDRMDIRRKPANEIGKLPADHLPGASRWSVRRREYWIACSINLDPIQCHLWLGGFQPEPRRRP